MITCFLKWCMIYFHIFTLVLCCTEFFYEPLSAWIAVQVHSSTMEMALRHKLNIRHFLHHRIKSDLLQKRRNQKSQLSRLTLRFTGRYFIEDIPWIWENFLHPVSTDFPVVCVALLHMPLLLLRLQVHVSTDPYEKCIICQCMSWGENVLAKLSYAIKRNTVAWAPRQFPINHRHLAQTSTNFFLLIRQVELSLSFVTLQLLRWRPYKLQQVAFALSSST